MYTMKKLRALLLAVVVVALAFSFGACAVGVTCISHIDRDGNGKCDNCGQAVTIVKSNVQSITIKTQPTKLYYALNETLDVTGGVLAVTYKDETPAGDIPFTAEGVNIAAPGMDSAGQKLVAVRYGGKTATYTIEVGLARYKVTFDLGCEDATPVPEQNVTINGHAAVPDDPTREGYDFAGWYTDATFATEFDFAMTPISADTVIYARWAERYTVTYAANYAGGKDKTAYTIKGKADATVVPETREGYRFAGWYAEAECLNAFGFDTVLTRDVTLYALWISESAATHTVTFDHNYGETPTTTTATVADGYKAAAPAAPTRQSVSTKGHQASDFAFGGWFTDAACERAFDFNTAVRSDLTLYAKWTGLYIFEAEHVSFMDPQTGQPMQGMGASGGSDGPNMVDSPPTGAEGINASNGYYVTYLYKAGLALNFIIESDRDVADATLIFRITAENAPYAINPYTSEGETFDGTRLSQYLITLNGQTIDYETIEITDTTGHTATGGKRPFSDHTLAVGLSLKKGRNVFTFLTANNNGMGGTMSATAPVIDCIKIRTSANLDWNPITSNEFGQ